MIKPLLMVTLSVARIVPPAAAVPPNVRTVFGARKRDEPASICKVLTLKEAPRLEAAELRRTFWSLKSSGRYSVLAKARILPAAAV